MYCHKTDNPFYIFAIRTCNTKGNAVRHLLYKLSRVTKFLLDRGTDITAVLTETHCRRFPLVGGWGVLEIPFLIIVEMYLNTLKVLFD